MWVIAVFLLISATLVALPRLQLILHFLCNLYCQFFHSNTFSNAEIVIHNVNRASEGAKSGSLVSVTQLLHVTPSNLNLKFISTRRTKLLHLIHNCVRVAAASSSTLFSWLARTRERRCSRLFHTIIRRRGQQLYNGDQITFFCFRLNILKMRIFFRTRVPDLFMLL